MTKKQVKHNREKADKTTKKQHRIIGRPFPPGISGNPKGRPKDSISLTSAIKRRLRELTPDGKREAIEMLADNIIQDALDSSDNMRKLIWNYIDGLPKQSTKIEIEGELPVRVISIKKYEPKQTNRRS